jgi:hypothetical protein
MGVSTKITHIRTNGGYAVTGNRCKGGRISASAISAANKTLDESLEQFAK